MTTKNKPPKPDRPRSEIPNPGRAPRPSWKVRGEKGPPKPAPDVGSRVDHSRELAAAEKRIADLEKAVRELRGDAPAPARPKAKAKPAPKADADK